MSNPVRKADSDAGGRDTATRLAIVKLIKLIGRQFLARGQDKVRQTTRSGTIMDVEHIVILMQENRSFDHYFGTMAGVRGFGDRFTIPSPSGSIWFQRNEQPGAQPAMVAPFRLDTEHGFAAMRVAGTPHLWPNAQRAWDHGRMQRWPTFKQNHAMGYYTQADIPFQFALADLFTVCDAYHCAFQGGTNPNRVFAWTGTNDPHGAGHGPVIGNSYDNLEHDPGGGYAWTTYPERLQAAGISWQVYQDMADNYTDNPLMGFRTVRAAPPGSPLYQRARSTRTLADLRSDVQAGALPQVSFIVATAEGSEHPVPSSPAQGAAYTAAVIEALASDPAVWSRTVLLLMFDENDGFFDHVPPPAPPSLTAADGAGGAIAAGDSTVSTDGEYHLVPTPEPTEDPALMLRPYGLGPRVPMIAISPWSRGGWVNSQVFDHTSVIRFIERRFGVAEPNISAWRRAVCGDLTSVFDFTRPDDSAFLHLLPATAPAALRARALGAALVPAAPETLLRPMQAAGTRPSRALPYVLDVGEEAGPDGRAMLLVLSNRGQAGAVFHVYDQLALDAMPRRFTVEAGKELRAIWDPSGDGSCDLWILGPNGFHRRLAARPHPAQPGVQAAFDMRGGVHVQLSNRGVAPLTFSITAHAYGEAVNHTVTVLPNERAAHAWSAAASGNWYDFSVRVAELPGYLRRFAGRIETGADGVSDPAIGALAAG